MSKPALTADQAGDALAELHNLDLRMSGLETAFTAAIRELRTDVAALTNKLSEPQIHVWGKKRKQNDEA